MQQRAVLKKNDTNKNNNDTIHEHAKENAERIIKNKKGTVEIMSKERETLKRHEVCNR